jgi:hypothetical protein
MVDFYTPQFSTVLVLESIKNTILDVPTYIYIADGVRESTSAEEVDRSVQLVSDVSNQILAGKRVLEEDIHNLIVRRPWVRDVIYTQYDNLVDLESTNFFVLSSNRAVYKCISNNYGAPCTIEPTSLDLFPTKYSDGYVWQYMFRLTNAHLNRYVVEGMIPVIVDSEMVAEAVPGTIDRVTVSNKGMNYTATHIGQFLEIVSNNLFRIDDEASTISDIYNDSSIYITLGSGVGQISQISDYTSNSSGKFVSTYDNLVGVGLDSNFEIAPAITIEGDGSGFKARSRVEGGQVVDVDVIDRGTDFSFANLKIVSSPGNGTGATCRAAISPRLGHGYDPSSELFSRSIVINTKFDDQDVSIPYGISFSKYGLARSLKEYANTDAVYDEESFTSITTLDVSYFNGSFGKGDIVSDGTNSASVVSSNGTSVGVIYVSPSYEFSSNTIVSNQGGVSGRIIDIEPSDIYTGDSEILSISTINTITRTNMSDETINIVLRV